MASSPFSSPSISINVNLSISSLNSFKEKITSSTVFFVASTDLDRPIVAAVEKSDFNSIEAPSIRSVIEFFFRVTSTPSSLNIASEDS